MSKNIDDLRDQSDAFELDVYNGEKSNYKDDGVYGEDEEEDENDENPYCSECGGSPVVFMMSLENDIYCLCYKCKKEKIKG
jgi:hypothetical protein